MSLSVPYGDCRLYKEVGGIGAGAFAKEFPSPMGIVVFIKDEKGSVLVEDIVKVSVPYGGCSLYKNDKEIVLEAVKKFPFPMGIVVFINGFSSKRKKFETVEFPSPMGILVFINIYALF